LNPNRFSQPAFRQYCTKSLDNTKKYCLRDFTCLAKRQTAKTAPHLSVRNFCGILDADDAALPTQGKEDKAKSTKKSR